MNENEIMGASHEPQPSPEDIARWEAEAEAERAAELAPYKRAAEQRKRNSALVAEHDNDLADILFEITMSELEG